MIHLVSSCGGFGSLTVTAAGRILDIHMNDQQALTELYQYLDRRFDSIDERFAAMDERFDAMDERFDVVEERLEGIETTVNAIHQRLEHAEADQAAMKSQLDRHDRWHHQTAGKLGVRLDH